jgi:hypothetical protein
VPVATASKALAPSRIRAAAAAGIVLALAAALTIATISRSGLGTTVSDAAIHGLNTMKTVAAMLADRSPGERAAGALASLKPKKQPALHERALPKVRKPESPLAGIVGTPPVPPVEAAPATPLFGLVAGPPVSVPPATIVPHAATPPGSDVPPPGGGVVVPPGNPPGDTPEVPPVTPAVPEPATWAMMLLGFAMIGWATRRERRGAAQAAG